MFEKIDHIAIAVEDLEKAVEFYRSVLGKKLEKREIIAAFAVEIATIDAGNLQIELVEGKGDDSAIKKFVDKHGTGIHHIAFLVDDIEEAMQELRSRGIKFIDERPRSGKEGSRVAFMHPPSTQGILYELVERRSKD